MPAKKKPAPAPEGPDLSAERSREQDASTSGMELRESPASLTLGLSPKLIAAVLTAVLGYLLGQTVLELPAGIVLAIQVVLVGLGVYAASPGDTTTQT